MTDDQFVSAEVVMVHDLERGVVRLEEGCVPPPVVSFCPKVVEIIRSGGSWWAELELDPENRHSSRGRHVVVMHLAPIVLRYRLTGEHDEDGGLVAERIDEDGNPWKAEDDAVR